MKEWYLCKKTKSSSEFMLYTETGNKSKVCYSCMEEIANGTIKNKGDKRWKSATSYTLKQ